MSDSVTAQPCQGLSWTYDAYGNRTDQNATAGTCGTFHASVGTNNQFTTSGYTYDAAGNTTHDASHSYTYDAENRITQVDGGSTATYVYDAEGLRVRTTVGSVTTDFMRDLSGNIVSAVNPSWDRSFIRANGALLAEYSEGTTYFVHPDHLGSSRLLTAPDQSVRECDDYYPYGEIITCGSTSASLLKFDGKEYDSESNLDNFSARFDSSSMGRFMTPDWAEKATSVPYADFGNPQSLNLYAFVKNNPTSFADLDGHCGAGGNGTERPCLVDAPNKTDSGGSWWNRTKDGDNPCRCFANGGQNQNKKNPSPPQPDLDQQARAARAQLIRDQNNKQNPALGTPEAVKATLGVAGEQADTGVKGAAKGLAFVDTVAAVAAAAVATGAAATAYDTAATALDSAQSVVGSHPGGSVDFANGFVSGISVGPSSMPGSVWGDVGWAVGKVFGCFTPGGC